MAYQVECACGRRIDVNASEAGTSRACGCGATVAVPSLSRLRERANLDAYESGVIDTIHRMLREGALPWGETCAASGEPTGDVIDLFVECERVHAAADPVRTMVLLTMLFGWIGMFLVRHEPRDARGRETIVWTPLRLARAHHHRFGRRSSRRSLRRLLRTVPIYGRLLDEYPRARIVVGANPGMDRIKLESLAADGPAN